MSINATTSLVVDSLYNSPYKGYYKKDYLAVIERLSKMGAGYFEDWMVDDFVREIVGGSESILKRYSKLGKAKQCAISMLEHYIFWTYEIGNKEEGDKLKKAFEETTKLKYNYKKVADIIRYNTTSKEVVPNNKSVLIAITPPKNKCVKFNVEGVIYPPEKPEEEHTVKNEVIFENVERRGFNFKWLMLMIILIVIINYKDVVEIFGNNKQDYLKHFTLFLKGANVIFKEVREVASPIVKDVMNQTNKVFNRIY